MVKRNGSYPADLLENMRGGEGSLKIEHLLTREELYEKGRLYALITVDPGSSIGFHVHEGEMESYYIISGEGEYLDHDETVVVQPGDITFTGSGQGHALKNTGGAPLKLIAQILYK